MNGWHVQYAMDDRYIITRHETARAKDGRVRSWKSRLMAQREANRLNAHQERMRTLILSMSGRQISIEAAAKLITELDK